jgi:4-hydroxymandelate oxidase
MNSTVFDQPQPVSLPDYEDQARQRLDAQAWAFFHGGAADELTARANQRAWAERALLPRVLRPLAGGHTRVSLLGRTLTHPILLAPVAHLRLAHPEGEIAAALAASALQAGLVLSTQSNTALEDVARAYGPGPDAGPLWFQLYLQPDRGRTRELLQRAEAAGYEALVLTVDAPCSGARDRERRVGFRLPAGVRTVHLHGQDLPAQTRLQPGQSALFDALLHHAPTWDDVAWLQAQTRLPVLLKGVLHPADARQAAGLHVAALIVSNHGGRTLDTAVPTAHALPRIAQALQGDLPLLVDGGIRRGTDVLKALALGASAVLIGRPYVYGLALAGAAGVAQVLRLLRDEFEIAMALCGCRTVADICADLLATEAGSPSGHN